MNQSQSEFKGNKSQLVKSFRKQFGEEALIIEAPGRINIIGEHTDYNDGFVLPAAINKSVEVVIQPSGSDNCHIIAKDISEAYKFSIDDVLQPVQKPWVNYFLGVIHELKIRGCIIQGFNLMFSSDIPIGAGMSSSAAIESSFGYALNKLFNLGLSRIELAHVGQLAEHKFVGVACGIMDQMASIIGKEGHVLKLDCRSLDYEYFPANFGDYELVLFDTRVKHSLSDSAYNQRREQCNTGVEIIQRINPQVSALRDVTLTDLDLARDRMSKIVYNRCKYIIEENQRVIAACEALQNDEINDLGRLMFETHKGLTDLYEVSCKELDILVDLARENNSIIGARMMGGGFGGCTINLVKSVDLNNVIEEVQTDYHKQSGIESNAYRVVISNGVHIK